MTEPPPRPPESTLHGRGGELDGLLERQRGTEAQLAQLEAGLADAQIDIGKLFHEVRALIESNRRIESTAWERIDEADRAEAEALVRAASRRIGEAAGPQGGGARGAADASRAEAEAGPLPRSAPAASRTPSGAPPPTQGRAASPTSSQPPLSETRAVVGVHALASPVATPDSPRIRPPAGTAGSEGGSEPLAQLRSEAPPSLFRAVKSGASASPVWCRSPTTRKSTWRSGGGKTITDRQAVERKMNDIEELRRERENEAPDDFATAAREWRGTVRGRLLKIAVSPALQTVSIVLSFLVIVPVWVSLDVAPDSQTRYIARVLQWVLCVFFMMEALLYLVAIPRLWRQWTYVLEIIIIVGVCVFEVAMFWTTTDPIAEVLLLIRVIRLPRVFGWVLDKYSDSPQVRTLVVLTSSLKPAFFTVCWVMLLLLIIFFIVACILRAILVSDSMDAYEPLVTGHFNSVHVSIMTLIEVFVGALDHTEDIFVPLLGGGLNSGAYAFIIVWMLYQGVMKLYFVNMFTGLFVELVFRSGEQSDASRKKSKGPLNISAIEAIFNAIDTENAGFITIVELEAHLEENIECHKTLGIVEDPNEKRGGMGSGLSDFLRSVDDCGMGVISISDFVHAVLKHKFGSRTVDQLVFNHQVVRLVKKCNQTNQIVTDVLAVVRHYSDRFDTFSKLIFDVRHSVVIELQTLRGDSQRLRGKVSAISQLLGLAPHDGPRLPPRVVHSIRGIREARDVSALMASVKEKLDAALRASGDPGAARALAGGPRRAPLDGREEAHGGGAAPQLWRACAPDEPPPAAGGTPASSRTARDAAPPSSGAPALSGAPAAAASARRGAGPSPVVRPDAPELDLGVEVEHQSSDFELVCNRSLH